MYGKLIIAIVVVCYLFIGIIVCNSTSLKSICFGKSGYSGVSNGDIEMGGDSDELTEEVSDEVSDEISDGVLEEMSDVK